MKDRIFTIPAAEPFLATLARAILDGDLPAPGGGRPSPLDLADTTVLLPTQGAAFAFANALLATVPDQALLLPKIQSIGTGEEEYALFDALADTDTAEARDPDIPPAMGEAERRLALTRLIMDWAEARRREGAADTSFMAVRREVAADRPAKAARLAADLCRLMEMVELEGASLAGLDDLVAEEFAEYWREITAFLDIITRAWPAHMAHSGRISAAARRNRLILAEARRAADPRSPRPIIVAGVATATGVTAELIGTVLRSPLGAVVLPALDRDLDGGGWDTIVPDHPEHPQFGFAKLLRRLNLSRSDVSPLPGAETPLPRAARVRFMSEALRPAATTERWRDVAARFGAREIETALAGVSLIEAPTAQDEAEVAALILRAAADVPGETASLVTPDRKLARRVAARLADWDIAVDGGANATLAKSAEGSFLDLVAGVAADAFAPAGLVALFNHPLFRAGMDGATLRVATRAFEIAAFRAPYVGQGLDAVERAFEQAERDVATHQRRHIAVTRLPAESWRAARDLLGRLRAAFKPLADVFAVTAPQPLEALALAHAATAEALARPPDAERSEDEAPPPWTGAAGETARALLKAMAEEMPSAIRLDAADYADFYRVLAGNGSVRSRAREHPRIFIRTPVEARLQETDVVVLGSLNEGTWPEIADPGPWLNRPMLKALGLPAPEERIGQAAHDFAVALGAARVVLTRAEKVDGVPTVPSRWLMRIKALLDAGGAKSALAANEPWLPWARARDHVEKRVRLAAPEPRPPVALRPRKTSVSNVEKWIANPYSVFARDILGLEALDEVGLAPGARIQGTIIHNALSRFSRKFPDEMPSEPERELMAFARGGLRAYTDDPRIAAFWLPRLERFACWFAETEPARRRDGDRLVTEVAGELAFEPPGGLFVLTARADRIDAGAEGLVITDYKLGSDDRVEKLAGRAARGEAPQLLLEAAIARTTGFVGVEPGDVRALRYISTSGGEPPGDEQEIKCADVGALATAAIEGFKRLVASYDDEATPYRALRRARFEYGFDEYGHLARVAEWSGQDDGGE